MLLEHPPYSPDLAPLDFHLFPKLELLLAGQSFSSDQEVISAADGYSADLIENHFRDGIVVLEHRWNVLRYKEIILKNIFEIIHLFFHCEG